MLNKMPCENGYGWYMHTYNLRLVIYRPTKPTNDNNDDGKDDNDDTTLSSKKKIPKEHKILIHTYIQ